MSSSLHRRDSEYDHGHDDNLPDELMGCSDMSYADLGNNCDFYAALNEPTVSVPDWQYETPDNTYHTAPPLDDATILNYAAPLLDAAVFNDPAVLNDAVWYEKTVLTLSSDDQSTYTVLAQDLPVLYQPAEYLSDSTIQAGSYDWEIPLQTIYQDQVPTTNEVISFRQEDPMFDLGCQTEGSPHPFIQHTQESGGLDEHAYDLQVPGSSDPQDTHFLSSTLDLYTPMERGGSNLSFTSTDSRRSNTTLISQSSVIERTCHLCPAVLTGKYCRRNLTRHMQTAHNEGGPYYYLCQEGNCSRKYRRSDALRAHQVKVHSRPPALRPPRLKTTLEEEYQSTPSTAPGFTTVL